MQINDYLYNVLSFLIFFGATSILSCAPNAPIKSKLQHPPPWENPGHLTISCARGVGNLTFTWVGWGKLNQNCQASSDFLFRVPKSLIAITTCLDEMEEFKGRDRTFVSDWLTKKGLQKL